MSRADRRRRENPFSLFSFQDIIASVTGIMLLITLLLVLELVMRKQGPASQPPDLDQLSAMVKDRQQQLAQLNRQLRDLEQTLQQAGGGTIITAAIIEELQGSVRGLTDQISTARRQLRDAQTTRQSLRTESASAARSVEELAREVQELKQKVQIAARTPRVTVLRGAQDKSPVWVEVAQQSIAAGLIEQQVPRVLQRFDGEGDNLLRSFLKWVRGRDRQREVVVLLIRADGVPHFSRLVSLLRSLGFDVGWDVWPAEKELFQSVQEQR